MTGRLLMLEEVEAQTVTYPRMEVGVLGEVLEDVEVRLGVGLRVVVCSSHHRCRHARITQNLQQRVAVALCS